MTVEHSQMSIAPEGTAVRIGTNTLNGQAMGTYVEPFDLPSDEAKRAVCEDHLERGLQGEMLDDFWMGGCDFAKSLEEEVVRVQFSCRGLSGVLKRCRLTLTQYDTAGNELNSGSYNTKVE